MLDVTLQALEIRLEKHDIMRERQDLLLMVLRRVLP